MNHIRNEWEQPGQEHYEWGDTRRLFMEHEVETGYANRSAPPRYTPAKSSSGSGIVLGIIAAVLGTIILLVIVFAINKNRKISYSDPLLPETPTDYQDDNEYDYESSNNFESDADYLEDDAEAEALADEEVVYMDDTDNDYSYELSEKERALEQIKSEIESSKNQLPFKSDYMTTCTNIYLTDYCVVYDYTVDESFGSINDLKDYTSVMKKERIMELRQFSSFFDMLKKAERGICDVYRGNKTGQTMQITIGYYEL